MTLGTIDLNSSVKADIFLSTPSNLGCFLEQIQETELGKITKVTAADGHCDLPAACLEQINPTSSQASKIPPRPALPPHSTPLFTQVYALPELRWIFDSRTGMGYKSPVIIQHLSSCSVPHLSECLLAPKKNTRSQQDQSELSFPAGIFKEKNQETEY